MAIGNIADLEKSLKLGEGSLQAAIDNKDSVDIEIPVLVIRTPDEDEELTANMKKEFHTAGREIAIKEARNELGLDFQGKTMANLLNAHKDLVLKDSAVEPNEKIKGLQSDLDAVRNSFESQTADFDLFKNETKKAQSLNKINDQILGSMEGEFSLVKSDLLTLFNAKHSSQINEDGKLEFSQNGTVLKNDTTRSLLNVQEVVSAFTKDFAKNTQKPGGGGGGDDKGGGSQSSMEKFIKEMEGNNIAPGGSEFNEEMQKRINAGTLKL